MLCTVLSPMIFLIDARSAFCYEESFYVVFRDNLNLSSVVFRNNPSGIVFYDICDNLSVIVFRDNLNLFVVVFRDNLFVIVFRDNPPVNENLYVIFNDNLYVIFNDNML